MFGWLKRRPVSGWRPIETLDYETAKRAARVGGKRPLIAVTVSDGHSTRDFWLTGPEHPPPSVIAEPRGPLVWSLNPSIQGYYPRFR